MRRTWWRRRSSRAVEWYKNAPPDEQIRQGCKPNRLRRLGLLEQVYYFSFEPSRARISEKSMGKLLRDEPVRLDQEQYFNLLVLGGAIELGEVMK